MDRLLESVALVPEHLKRAEIWRSLVIVHQARGVQVHDARLVAGMKAYGIRRVLLTRKILIGCSKELSKIGD
jgi:hypothetical protein